MTNHGDTFSVPSWFVICEIWISRAASASRLCVPLLIRMGVFVPVNDLSHLQHQADTTSASNQVNSDAEATMRLGDFLNVTAGIPETELRRAMVAALSVEPARTPDAFGRFYDRVVRDLKLDLIAEIGNRLPGEASAWDCHSTTTDACRARI